MGFPAVVEVRFSQVTDFSRSGRNTGDELRVWARRLLGAVVHLEGRRIECPRGAPSRRRAPNIALAAMSKERPPLVKRVLPLTLLHFCSPVSPSRQNWKPTAADTHKPSNSTLLTRASRAPEASTSAPPNDHTMKPSGSASTERRPFGS